MIRRCALLVLFLGLGVSLAAPVTDASGGGTKKAVSYIKSQIKSTPHPSGSPWGQSTSAICGLALLASGVSPGDAAIQYAEQDVRKFIEKTYEAGDRLQCNWVLGFGGLFYAELAARGKKHEDIMKKIVELLQGDQTKDGGWGHQKAPTKLIAGYPDTFFEPTFWCSSALGALKRAGMEVDPSALEKAIALFERGQMKDGGWAYDAGKSRKRGEAGRSGAGIFAVYQMDRTKSACLEGALAYYRSMIGTAPDGHSYPAMHIMSAGLACASTGEKSDWDLFMEEL
ncbi:MAG: prenyltransferase/squalene oxidase repeat-containing protein, partial [Planctomycetota bacterium]